MIVPSWASPGSGLPDNYCAYNASPARLYKPQSVINIEVKLKQAKDKKRKLENKIKRIDCVRCTKSLKFFVSALASEQFNDYTNHMAGGGSCTPKLTNISIYNYWANINNWERINNQGRNITQGRTIAGGDGRSGSSDELVSGDPVSNSNSEVRPPKRIKPAPDFVPSCPKYAGPNGSIHVDFCKIAEGKKDSNGSLYFAKEDRRLCRKCLRGSITHPSGRHSFCLSSKALIAELEDQIEDLEDELEEAVEIASDNQEKAVCADCMIDNRSWFEKYGPTLLAGGITAAAGYFAMRSERESYKHYKNVIHPDNNKKGYPTPMMSDKSGLTFATVMIGGLPVILNTAIGTGAFGCSGSSVFGGGLVTSGVFSGHQVGGVTGLPSVLNGALGGRRGGGSVSVGAGATINGGNGGYILGPNGQAIYNGGQGAPYQTSISTAQIRAQIAESQRQQAALRVQQQQQLQALQAQQAALSRQYTYASSYNALTEQYRAGVSALGPAPNVYGSGGYISGGSTSGVLPPPGSSVLTGGINIGVGAHLSTGGAAGVGGPPIYRAVPNPHVPPRQRAAPSGAGVNRL